MRVVYTAIFGPYEELKEPTVITPGWKYICYSDQPFTSKVWEIRELRLPFNDILAARHVKINFDYFIDAELSIWVDGSFTINCDLDKWLETHFKKDMTCIKHPIRDCIYDEGEVCQRYGKDNGNEISTQLKKYEELVPKRNGLIQSGILMRKHTSKVVAMCDEWWHQVLLYSDRDQISFGKACYGKTFIHYIKWDYRSGQEFIYKRHFKNRK